MLTDEQAQDFTRRLRRFQEADQALAAAPAGLAGRAEETFPEGLARLVEEYLVTRAEFQAVAAAAGSEIGVSEVSHSDLGAHWQTQ